MSDPYVAELRMFSFNFPPKGWALCNGQTLSIQQNQAVFALLGTTYGGNGTTTFQLPNLQGAAPIYVGPGFVQGQRGGEANHTIITAETPTHTHNIVVDPAAAGSNDPQGKTFAAAAGTLTSGYAAAGSAQDAPMNANMLVPVGGSQPHSNEQPYLVVSWCIALVGIFPSRN